jgi:predicted ABC-type ATPase
MAIVLGGVNGAGKSTSARALLAEQLSVTTFVNADEIARGLNAFAPQTAAFAAGRVMLQRLEELVADRADFAFETTLAGRTYLRIIEEWRRNGYGVEMYYYWLRSPELALSRVLARVRRGGHDIPEPVLRQRFGRSLHNFWHDYRHTADSWFVYDNSGDEPVLLAAGSLDEPPQVGNQSGWQDFRKAVDDA